MRKFSRQDKKKITQDWLSIFPSMGIYKPMWLMNRIGPLVVGINLQVKSGNENYTPTFHVHCLLREFSVVTLSLYKAPLGYVTLPRHEMYFHDVIEKFKSNILISLDGNIELDQLLFGYRSYLHNPTFSYQEKVYEDMILLASWYNDSVLRGQLLAEARKEVSTWPNDVKEHIGGVDSWISKIDRDSADKDKLQQIYEKELVKLKLEQIPARNIVGGNK